MSFIKSFITILILALIIFLLWRGFYFFSTTQPAQDISQEEIFSIKEGDNIDEIASNLRNKGLINSEFWLKFYIEDQGLGADIKAGDHVLNTSNSIREVATALTSGPGSFEEETIRVIEGWDISDIGEYLEEKGLFPKDDWFEFTGRADPYGDNDSYEFEGREYDFLDKERLFSLEGYLFPDTYKVYKDSEPADVAMKMLDNFDRKLGGKMKEDIVASGRSIHDIVIMASLLEREVRTYEDMRIVAGIFWDKIERGEALRSCATLAYILGENKPKYSVEDTKVDSPFNTYQNPGLPPAPISNPGENAIRAAIYPAETDYNYFLNTLDTGETIFSRTFEEHKRNKVKYLR